MCDSFQPTNITMNHWIPFYFCPQDMNRNFSTSVNRSWVFYIPITITVISLRFGTTTSLAVSSPKFYHHLQAPANPSHNCLSQHPSTHQWNLQLVKSRCSSYRQMRHLSSAQGLCHFQNAWFPFPRTCLFCTLPLRGSALGWIASSSRGKQRTGTSGREAARHS